MPTTVLRLKRLTVSLRIGIVMSFVEVCATSTVIPFVVPYHHPCSTAPNSGHYIEKLLLKEPFEPLSTWSSKRMVMVNNDREVCLAMDYL
jgi:hypothetical protein